MHSTSPGARRRFTVRFLRTGDIPSLLDLERRQWTADQSAGADDFRARIAAFPDLCVGAWCTRTGELRASVFCKPTREEDWVRPRDWAQHALPQANAERAPSMRCLFGISLTSIDADAALQLIAFNYLYGLKRGVRTVFLGSPMPGLRRHLERHPGATADSYARATRNGLPLDPQLRYYHGKGWRDIVCVRPGYFPHPDSLDHGVILKTELDFAWLRPALRFMPVAALKALAALAPRIAIPERKAPIGRPHPQS